MTTTRPTTSTRAADPVAADLEDLTPMNSTTTSTATSDATDSTVTSASDAGTAADIGAATETYEWRARELLTYVFCLDGEFGPETEPYPYRDLEYCDPLTDDPDRARGWRYTLHRIEHTIMALHTSAELTRDHAHQWARWASTQARHRLPWVAPVVDIDDLINSVAAQRYAPRRATVVVLGGVVDLDSVATTLARAVAAADAVTGAYERHAAALDDAADQQARDLVALYLNPPVEQDNPHDPADPTHDEHDEEGLAGRRAAERFAAIEDQARLESALLAEVHRRWAS